MFIITNNYFLNAIDIRRLKGSLIALICSIITLFRQIYM